MIVYIVSEMYFGPEGIDTRIDSVFLIKELAQKYIDSKAVNFNFSYDISEHEVTI